MAKKITIWLCNECEKRDECKSPVEISLKTECGTFDCPLEDDVEVKELQWNNNKAQTPLGYCEVRKTGSEYVGEINISLSCNMPCDTPKEAEKAVIKCWNELIKGCLK